MFSQSVFGTQVKIMSLITYYGTKLLLVKHLEELNVPLSISPTQTKKILYSCFKQPTEIIRGFY